MKVPKVRVFGPKVLIQRKGVESSVIDLSAAKSLTLDEGTVIGLGPEVHEYCDIKVGDVVVWGKYAEGQVSIEDNKFVIVNAGDLIYGKELA